MLSSASVARHVRLFKIGTSQAVRIPRVRLTTYEAILRRDEQGRLIPEPADGGRGFVTAAAASEEVVIENRSSTDPLVLPKHFGPGNPHAAPLLQK